MSQPRIVISALRGGSGKTILSLGMAAEWSEMGYRVAAFKKGPDFIDSGWLSLAAGRPCHNLDPFMISREGLLYSFFRNSLDADLSLIEGNRGLFDGMDLKGRYSTAEVAKLLKCPVIVIIDVTMTTRTAAAIVMGCQKFDPELDIAGVILNRVAGKRQAGLVKESIETYCNIPVLGQIPKLKQNPFPERHMGLVPHLEREQAEKAVEWAKSIAEDHLDLQRILEIARGAGPFPYSGTEEKEFPLHEDSPKITPRIGFIRDKAFWFYYPENLAQLGELGAQLVEINSITSDRVPEVDALYIGGGFPEVQAESLSSNADFRHWLRGAILGGLPVYAECGGLMYLGEGLILGESYFPMVGALPIRFRLEEKPQGHGYTILKVKEKNPYFPVGETLKGHEFHYSRPIFDDLGDVHMVFEVERGHGLDGRRDGLTRRNLLATYTHLHALGYRAWAERFFEAAMFYKTNIKGHSDPPG
ncbi:MAG: hydrogenobyrinic acid a,c-diamide synthase (glutamine-hydrolyzing) [Deltaproteobacteria bacterium]|nr:hydrogenobyrinic acid a,c-diamide synthase (glutamine-hydrolyzing) [Deltaproteobacteria bacterium]